MPMPHDPCRAAPRADSRARLAARWWRRQQRVAVHGEPVERVTDAERPQVIGLGGEGEGSTSMSRDRCVRTPGVNVPEPNWANVWCRPSGVTTLCAACAPPLNRTTAATGDDAQRWSTTVPARVPEAEVDDDHVVHGLAPAGNVRPVVM